LNWGRTHLRNEGEMEKSNWNRQADHRAAVLWPDSHTLHRYEREVRREIIGFDARKWKYPGLCQVVALVGTMQKCIANGVNAKMAFCNSGTSTSVARLRSTENRSRKVSLVYELSSCQQNVSSFLFFYVSIRIPSRYPWKKYPWLSKVSGQVQTTKASTWSISKTR
jgi:hypothetical protein